MQKRALPFRKAGFVQMSVPVLLTEKLVVIAPGVEEGVNIAYGMSEDVENSWTVPLEVAKSCPFTSV